MADWLPMSTRLVAPTSTRAASTVYRPEIELLGITTMVMCEQVTAVDIGRLGPAVGRLSSDELARVDDALRLVLDVGPQVARQRRS
jgi:mRNA interferase MazF